MRPSITTNLAVFASGTGTNAANIIQYFNGKEAVHVAVIVSNNANAGVLTVAAKNNINSLVIEKEKFFRGDGYVPELKDLGIDFIVLAGFLWKIPSSLIT